MVNKKPESKTLEAYIKFYGKDLGKLEWSRYEAERRIKDYHRRKLREERQKDQKRAERVYNSVMRILRLDAAEVDLKDENELNQYIISEMFNVFNEAQMRQRENMSQGSEDSMEQ